MTITRVLKSVFAAILGVQKSKNAEEDFNQGNPWVYLSVGVAVVVIIVITLAIIVRLVLNP